MKFAELDEKTQISKIKTSYLAIVSTIHGDHKALDKYLPELPVGKSAEDVSLAEARKGERAAVLKTIGGITARGDCICTPYKCLDISTDEIPEAFEIIIEVARAKAEGENH